MSKINNWFQIHEVYIEEVDNRPNRGPGCGIGMLDGCGSGKGVISNNPHKDHDNKFGLGLEMVVVLVTNVASKIS